MIAGVNWSFAVIRACSIFLLTVLLAQAQDDSPAPPALSPLPPIPPAVLEETPEITPPAPLPDKEERRELKPRTISKSLQFIIHGSDFVTRAAMATLAEEMREVLHQQVGKEERWVHPITIQLHGVEGDPAPAQTMRTSYYHVPGGYRLQLDIHLAKGKPRGLDRALLELLLVEWGLRKQGLVPEELSLAISPWLLDGLMEAFLWKKGHRDRNLYGALFEKKKIFPVRKLLDEEDPSDMDAMTRTAYRASAGALVMALLSQNGGQASLRGLLRDAASFEGDEMALLMKHFPGMNLGPRSFSKWWSLQLAQMSETSYVQLLDLRASERELAELLVIRIKDLTGNVMQIPPTEYADLIGLPEKVRQEAIKPVLEEGARFYYRAFPEHRTILTEYLTILTEVATDKDNDIAERVQSLAQRRRDLAALGLRVRDYLDWYRITSAKRLSGDFQTYIDLKESLEEAPNRRTGPVSSYLDKMQEILKEE